LGVIFTKKKENKINLNGKPGKNLTHVVARRHAVTFLADAMARTRSD
jgi:hypothetical protein